MYSYQTRKRCTSFVSMLLYLNKDRRIIVNTKNSPDVCWVAGRRKWWVVSEIIMFKMCGWSKKKKFNDSKTEFIIFRSPLLKQHLRELYISVGDSQVFPSSKVRDLGVVLTNISLFIISVCRSTHFHLRGIGRIRNLLTVDATAQLIHTLITSRLDFCNSILYNLPNNKIKILQRIQNQAAHMVKRIPRRNHITPVLRELHWLRIHDNIIFKILLLIHKAVNKTAPEYLCDLIRFNVQSTTIRTRASFDPCLLCVPPISEMCANSFLDR